MDDKRKNALGPADTGLPADNGPPPLADSVQAPGTDTLRQLAARVGRDGNDFADLLAPVAGKVFARAARLAVRRFVGKFNHFIIHYVLLRDLRWRIQALVERRSFQDVVMQHSLLNRVKTVMLIHRRTGALLHRIGEAPHAPHHDGEDGGILDAIQDFTLDSFRRPDKAGSESIQVGEISVCVEQGPLAILAGVVYGTVTQTLSEIFADALTEIHREFGRDLESFRGDTSVFVHTAPILEQCLRVEFKENDEPLSLVTCLALVLPFAALGVWLWLAISCQIRWSRAVSDLSDEPGIVVVDAGGQFGVFHISGLRDPMAEDPDRLLAAAGFDSTRVKSRWQWFESHSHEIVTARTESILAPPETVRLTWEGDTLYASGSASAEWLDRARVLAGHIPGLLSLDVSKVTENGKEAADRWERAVAELGRRPGIVVANHGVRDGAFHVSGLRDPLATNPDKLLEEMGIDPSRVESNWEPFYSMERDFVLARARRILAPPKTVSIDIKDGMLTLTGMVSHGWLVQTRILARGIAGISGMNDDGVEEVELEELKKLVHGIEQQTFNFFSGTTDMWPGEKRQLGVFFNDIQRAQLLADRINRVIHIDVMGHSNESGDDKEDGKESLLLAKRFHDILAAQNIDMGAVAARGIGNAALRASAADGEKPRRRCVSFSARIQAGDAHY